MRNQSVCSVLFLLGVVLSPGVRAAEGDAKIVGALDIRPTWTTKSGKWGTENLVTAGYQFNPNLQLLYTQLFVSNLFNPKSTPDTEGLQLAADFGMIRLKLNNLYVSPDEKFSFGYEPRIYLPTLKSARDAGMIVASRNILKFNYKATSKLTLAVQEIPILLIYNRAGSDIGGTPSANPVFENRTYFMADISITSKLVLSLNLLLHQTLNRAYSTQATNDNKWTFTVWTYPELNYSITNNSTIGIAYYSGNLVSSDLSAAPVGAGLEDGAVQMSFATTL